ncbi:MAG: diguanylate cyclase domain-containing protein, partial [Chloroflexota bacterium]
LRLGERLLAQIRRPVVTSVGVLGVGASIGLVIVPPGPGPSIEELMKQADLTMQAVKRAGGGVRLYEPDDDEESS